MGSVVLTTDAIAAWQAMAGKVAQATGQLGIRPEQIPDEEIWLKDDEATLVIRCQAGRLLVEMEVPVGQWSWAN